MGRGEGNDYDAMEAKTGEKRRGGYYLIDYFIRLWKIMRAPIL
jgi:hypothetical protein